LLETSSAPRSPIITMSSSVELLASELVTNVARHAETQFTVVVVHEPGVRVEVHDGVAATEAFRDLVNNPQPSRSDSPGGRGLPLVRAVATGFGLHREPGRWNGKIVWFEVDPTDLLPLIAVRQRRPFKQPSRGGRSRQLLAEHRVTVSVRNVRRSPRGVGPAGKSLSGGIHGVRPAVPR
jgi:hypothetical protein